MNEIKVTVFEVKVCLDQDDPDLIAGFALGEWEKSEAGKWILKNARTSWHRISNLDPWTMDYKIVATITPEKYTFWSLTYK